jgi:hypothetical protein
MTRSSRRSSTGCFITVDVALDEGPERRQVLARYGPCSFRLRGALAGVAGSRRRKKTRTGGVSFSVVWWSEDPVADMSCRSVPIRLSQQRGSPHSSVPKSVPKRGPKPVIRQPTPTTNPIKNGPEIVDFRPVLRLLAALANRRLRPLGHVTDRVSIRPTTSCVKEIVPEIR